MGNQVVALPKVGTGAGTLRILDAGGVVLDQVTGRFFVERSGEWFVNASATTSDGLTFGTGFRTIDDALARAEYGQTIRVVEGTYSVTETRNALVTMKDGVALVGGYDASGIYDPAAHSTVLNGFDGSGVGRLVDHVVIGANGELRGFTVQGGWTRDATGSGGGLLIIGDSMVVDACMFQRNEAFGGAGIGMLGGAELRITNSEIRQNARGSGIFADGARLHSVATSFDRNDSGIVVNDEDVVIEGGRFSNNGDRDIVVRRADAYVSDVFLDEGETNFSDGSVKLERTVFFESRGTPVEGSGGTDDVFELVNCVFANSGRGSNRATAINVSTANVQLIHTTLYATRASPTFRGSANYTVTTSIVWHSESNVPVFDDDSTGTVTYSIVHENIAGVGNVLAAPQFVNAGGGDLSLSSGSPAIDAGDGSVGPNTDINGAARVDSGAAGGTGTAPYPDLGAYEF
ncbi:MAG: right-handed parallel beta-helix repeat-containing protein [Myxococcota bacterium]